MNTRAIRTQIADALDGLGYRTYDVLPENAELPAAVVGWPEEVRYHVDGAGGVDLDLAVTIAVPRSDWDAAQHDIDAAINPTGPPAAIQAHQTTEWHQIVVRTAGNIRPIDVPAALAVDLNLSIYAP